MGEPWERLQFWAALHPGEPDLWFVGFGVSHLLALQAEPMDVGPRSNVHACALSAWRLQVEVMDEADFEMASDVCGVLVQYPATDGSIHDYKARCAAALFQTATGARVLNRFHLAQRTVEPDLLQRS